MSMRERVLKDEMGLEDYLNKLNEEYKISNDTTHVLFQLGREKKEIHYRKFHGAVVDAGNGQVLAI